MVARPSAEVSNLYAELVATESGNPNASVFADIGLRAIALEYLYNDELHQEYLNRIWQEASYCMKAIKEGWTPYDRYTPKDIIKIA